MLRGLITAIRTLTILPVPGRDAEKMSASLPWFPVVGLLLGAILWAVARGAMALTPLFWPEAAGVLVVVGGAVLTRGLHLDGLGDWADGFWGARDKEKVLAIMKDPRTGAFGVVALVSVLLGQWVCVTRLASAGGLEWILVAYVISRTMQVDLAVAHPYARAEGGTGAPFVAGARPKHLLVAILVAGALLLAVGRGAPVCLVALLIAWLMTRLFGFRCRRRIGGITGDLLGAGSVLTETTVLFIGAVLNAASQ
ncbi:MAG: adenosylcobinamide-GDP ribazoletransferase [Lentisphaerae bacterium]|nr:adenosylcobinamide-GDP ribazoletransferase [Lentisphaerota bacterium]